MSRLHRILSVNETCRVLHKYCYFQNYRELYRSITGFDPPGVFKEYYPDRRHRYHTLGCLSYAISGIVCQTNTFLCPFCEPFKLSDGKRRWNARFYVDDLDDRVQRFGIVEDYDLHLSLNHGVHRQFGLMMQPFVGHSMTKFSPLQLPNHMKLTCICPYSKQKTPEPCLSEFELDIYGESEVPYKNYFKHVHSYHFASENSFELNIVEGIKYEKTILIGNEECTNWFHPLSMEYYCISLESLKRSCGDSSIDPIAVSLGVSEQIITSSPPPSFNRFFYPQMKRCESTLRDDIFSKELSIPPPMNYFRPGSEPDFDTKDDPCLFSVDPKLIFPPGVGSSNLEKGPIEQSRLYVFGLENVPIAKRRDVSLREPNLSKIFMSLDFKQGAQEYILESLEQFVSMTSFESRRRSSSESEIERDDDIFDPIPNLEETFNEGIIISDDDESIAEISPEEFYYSPGNGLNKLGQPSEEVNEDVILGALFDLFNSLSTLLLE